jgi:hypothetical protein
MKQQESGEIPDAFGKKAAPVLCPVKNGSRTRTTSENQEEGLR